MLEVPPATGSAPPAGAERLLSALEQWAADRDRPVIVLTGAAGTGKTLLLDRFASRAGRRFSVVRLGRCGGSDPDEISARILTALGQPVDGTPRLALARVVQGLAARPLLLLFDDAEGLSPRVEMWLFDLARRSAGAVRVALALSDARLAGEFAAAFRAGTEVVSIDTKIGRSEGEASLGLVAERASESRPAANGARLDEIAAPGEQWTALSRMQGERSARGARAPLPASVPAEPLWPPTSPRAQPTADASPPAVVTPRSRSATPTLRLSSDPIVAGRSGFRLRWIALAAAVVLGFAGGFAISEWLDTRTPATPAIASRGRTPDAPAVSAPPLDPRPAAPGSSLSAVSPKRSAAPAAETSAPPVPVPVAPRAAEAETARWSETAAPAAAATSAPATIPEPSGPVGPDTREETSAPAAEEPIATDGAAPAELPAAATAPTELPAAATAARGAPLGTSLDTSAEGRLATNPDAAPAGDGPAAPAVSSAPPRRPRSVAVQVRAEPGTEIRIDGRALGVAPVAATELAPGLHRLLVRTPDGRELERVVEVRGSRYEIEVR